MIDNADEEEATPVSVFTNFTNNPVPGSKNRTLFSEAGNSGRNTGLNTGRLSEKADASSSRIGKRARQETTSAEKKLTLERQPTIDISEERLKLELRKSNCKIQPKKIAKDKFKIGSRTVQLKEMDGHLVIRTGGGYMAINSFIATELEDSSSELQKQGSGRLIDHDVDKMVEG